MIQQLLDWLGRAVGAWKPWVVVPPWERVVRVRLGRHAKVLGPGPHLRIPMVDQLTHVNTRLRVETSAPVTIQNGTPGKARVLTTTVAFRITDPLRAIMAYTYPGPAVLALVQAHAARLVKADECRRLVSEQLAQNGIEVAALYYTDDVDARTYRLIQAGGGPYLGTDIGVGPPRAIL